MVALALALATVPAVLAQDSPLTEKQAKKELGLSQKALKQAEAASRRADAADLAEQARQHSQAMERLNRALANGHVRESDALDVAARVDQATLRHIPVLEGLLETAPAQAQPALLRALEASLTGHMVASQAVVNRGRPDLSGILTDRAARDAMRRNDALVENAERNQRAIEVLTGLLDTVPAQARPGIERALAASQTARDASVNQFGVNIGAIARAIEMDAVSESDAVSVFDRVDRNTRRHQGILEGLLGQVPHEAQQGILRALEASRKGNQAATAAIARTPAAGVASGRPGQAGPPSGIGGGPPSSVPKPPAGPPSGAGRPPR
jgi:CBS domain-containing protein